MRKIISLVLALIVGLVTPCFALAEEQTDVVVFAAASLTETLTELKPLYEAARPGVNLVFNFDSSGTLKTQITEGADCDVFVSAGQKQMDELECVMEDTRIDLLENKVTLVTPEGNPKEITSFDDLAERLREGDILLCMGNSDVPVGQYTQKILAFYGLDEAELAQKGCITYGTNVKEVTTQVMEASVDCGVIYGTDAYSAGLTPLDSATAEMCGQVIYPAAVMTGSAHPELAKEFLTYLTSEEAMAVFQSVGFANAAANQQQGE